MNQIDNPFPPLPENTSPCLHMLRIILYGESTKAQQEYFFNHIELCKPCAKNYQLETRIQQLIKSKCSKKSAPDDLIEKIKTRIQSTS